MKSAVGPPTADQAAGARDTPTAPSAHQRQAGLPRLIWSSSVRPPAAAPTAPPISAPPRVFPVSAPPAAPTPAPMAPPDSARSDVELPQAPSEALAAIRAMAAVAAIRRFFATWFMVASLESEELRFGRPARIRTPLCTVRIQTAAGADGSIAAPWSVGKMLEEQGYTERCAVNAGRDIAVISQWFRRTAKRCPGSCPGVARSRRKSRESDRFPPCRGDDSARSRSGPHCAARRHR